MSASLSKLKENMSNKALLGTVIVTVGVFIGNIFSYLLQLYLGRTLSVEDFGIFTALLSFSTLITVINGTLSTSVIKMVAVLKSKEDFSRLTHLFVQLTKIFFVFGGLVFFLLFLLRVSVGGFLNVRNTITITFFSLFVGISFLDIVPNSYLQGLLRFKAFAFWTVNKSFLRFVIPSAIVFLNTKNLFDVINGSNYEVAGVYGGMALAILLSFLVGVSLLKKNFTGYEKVSLNSHYKKLLLFAGPVLFVQGGMILLSNMDVILVKHFFSEQEAGLYSGVVTLGKILLFGAGTVGIVMFPQISESFAAGGDYKERFKFFLLLQIGLVAGGILVFSTFPGILTQVMFGEKYLPSVRYLPKFSVFIGLYVLVNLLILYFLAIEKTKVFLFQIPAVLAQVVLIYKYHNSLTQVININVGIVLVLFICVMLYYLLNAHLDNSSGLQAG